MFGYVRLYKPECKFREYEYYRGVYCGVCSALGRCGGACARMTLSYDAAFLALVRLALEGETPRFAKKRCLAHPLRRHTEALPTHAAELSARASLILTFYKNTDDLADDELDESLDEDVDFDDEEYIYEESDADYGDEE